MGSEIAQRPFRCASPRQNERASSERTIKRGAGGHPRDSYVRAFSRESLDPARDRAGNHVAGFNLRWERPPECSAAAGGAHRPPTRQSRDRTPIQTPPGENHTRRGGWPAAAGPGGERQPPAAPARGRPATWPGPRAPHHHPEHGVAGDGEDGPHHRRGKAGGEDIHHILHRGKAQGDEHPVDNPVEAVVEVGFVPGAPAEDPVLDPSSMNPGTTK